MKKITNVKPLASLIMGFLLILYSFSFFDTGGGVMIVIGIFAILCGLASIFAGVLDFTNNTNANLVLTKSIILIVALPLFYFIYSLMMMIAAANALDVVGWIEIILLLLSSLCIVALGIMSFFIEKVDSVCKISICVFFSTMILIFIFPFGSNQAALGDIPLLISVLFICYFVLVKDFAFGVNEKAEAPKKEEALVEEPQIEEQSQDNNE